MTTSSNNLFNVKLTRHEEISPGVFVIGFPRRHDVKAGQAVRLTVDETVPARIYSICSGTTDDELCVLFNIKNDGLLTPRLAALKVGDTIRVSPPYGTFTGNRKPAWWIATGTGIAPFRSMLRSGLGHNKQLVHGVRHLNQFYFEDELRDALGDQYHPCCSAEEADGVYSGRVTGFLNARQNLPTDVLYYICGQASMAVDVRDLLIARGIPFANIVTEIYF